MVVVVVLECMVILWILVVMVGREVVEVMLVLGWKGVVSVGSDGVVVMGKGVMVGEVGWLLWWLCWWVWWYCW